MCASKVAEGKQRGWIIPIGGAEEKDNAPAILRRFVQLAGGDQADIVVIPTASQLKSTGPRYERIFAELGAARVSALDFDTRRDCDEPSRISRLHRGIDVSRSCCIKCQSFIKLSIDSIINCFVSGNSC